MKKRQLLQILMVLITDTLFSQEFKQYFDGADTICNTMYSDASICISLVDDSTNIWQIGVPQKLHFDSAATLPNALRSIYA